MGIQGRQVRLLGLA